MDAGGTGHLRDARYGVLHLSRRGKHEIGQLINHHDDIAKLVWNLQFLLTWYGDLLIDLHGKAVLTSLNPFFGTAKERQLRFGFRLRFLGGALVERMNVLHVFLRENLVALLHLLHHPAEGEDHLLGVGHHRHHKVR